MKNFFFRGDIPTSKSLMNRALLVRSYFPALRISGNSACDDVRLMKLAIVSLIKKEDIDCGEAGTVLRFMALRAARESGTFKLIGSERLFSRPQDDLIFLLGQLGIDSELRADSLLIRSSGWKKPLIPIRVHRDKSSQFASSLLLNSWNLPFDLEFEMKSGVSEGYWQMTVEMVRALGLRLDRENDSWRIDKKQSLTHENIELEPDYSSTFAIAAAAALAGRCEITNAKAQSLQPDHKFIQILQKMGALVEWDEGALIIEKPKENLRAVDVDLSSCPDLFPVLSVLCAFAKGESILSGAPHLIYKESNRLLKTQELLQQAGFVTSAKEDGLHILGHGSQVKQRKFQFDPDLDHRMAMAAGLLALKNFDVNILNARVVSKSFPEFWTILAGTE
jgi:3-phosphoshikimate 1-carboxyvinyltransferase